MTEKAVHKLKEIIEGMKYNNFTIGIGCLGMLELYEGQHTNELMICSKTVGTQYSTLNQKIFKMMSTKFSTDIASSKEILAHSHEYPASPKSHQKL